MIGLIVFLLALSLSSILMPLGFLWGVGEAFVNRGYVAAFEKISKYFFAMALSIDQTGNVICKEFFNDTLVLSRSVHRFGNPDETISGVLGKNQLNNTLTKAGQSLNYILNLIEKDHSIKAIEEDEV